MSRRNKVFVVIRARIHADPSTKKLFQNITGAKQFAEKYKVHIVEQFSYGKNRRAPMVFEGFHYAQFGDIKTVWDFCPQVTQ